MKQMTRRQFVIDYSMAAAGLMGTGTVSFGLISPHHAFADEIEFIESSCGTQGKSILVAYESFCGSTSQIAQTIANVFCRQGAKVDVRHIDNINNFSSYGGVVLGSAVRSGSWYPNAITFVKENQNQLMQIPVVYFLTCLALYFDNKEAHERAKSYFNPVLKAVPEVQPKGIQAFAGKLDYSKLNIVYKMVLKSKMKKKGIPEGDFRDFQKIESWARKTAWPLLATV